MSEKLYTRASIESEGSATDTYTFPKAISFEDALRILDENGVSVDGYKCRHEHDCCGGWYPSRVRAQPDDNNTILIQKWYQNI